MSRARDKFYLNQKFEDETLSEEEKRVLDLLFHIESAVPEYNKTFFREEDSMASLKRPLDQRNKSNVDYPLHLVLGNKDFSEKYNIIFGIEEFKKFYSTENESIKESTNDDFLYVTIDNWDNDELFVERKVHQILDKVLNEVLKRFETTTYVYWKTEDINDIEPHKNTYREINK